jgi:hypothetical protein
MDGTPAWVYDEDGYCMCCGNGRWKPHMAYCDLRDVLDRLDTMTRIVNLAAGIVDGSDETDDGMVEIKWDEFVHLQDAIANWRTGATPR